MVEIEYERILELAENVLDVYNETVESLTDIKEELLEAIATDKDVSEDNKRFLIHELKTVNPENPLDFYRFVQYLKHALNPKLYVG